MIPLKSWCQCLLFNILRIIFYQLKVTNLRRLALGCWFDAPCSPSLLYLLSGRASWSACFRCVGINLPAKVTLSLSLSLSLYRCIKATRAWLPSAPQYIIQVTTHRAAPEQLALTSSATPVCFSHIGIFPAVFFHLVLIVFFPSCSPCSLMSVVHEYIIVWILTPLPGTWTIMFLVLLHWTHTYCAIYIIAFCRHLQLYKVLL